MYRESLFSAVGDHILWAGVGRIIKSLNGGGERIASCVGAFLW